MLKVVGPELTASLHRQVNGDIDKTWEIQPVKYVDVGTEALPEEGQMSKVHHKVNQKRNSGL